ncbi:IQ domain-containing protein F2-like [Ochotona princeps]|uniref:IQ domain-containing protein F2-like n=1 Tax=Ochotona princeps TaxID=9978 RepID=UPI0027148479|nr:IQ domain-containing protein F2-like [Ochotona princeps]
MGIRFCIEDDVEEITYWQIQQKKRKQQKELRRRETAAIKIQAWWRGTLVRRTLLHMALRACIIQRWWKMTLLRMLEKKRRAALLVYAQRERAVTKLQSLVRMWRIHWRYCQVLHAIYVIQCHWQCHSCQTCAQLQGHCVVTATHLQFHIEIINS